MKIVAIIQSRLSSTRFPLKAVAMLAGHPMLAHVITRAKQMQTVQEIVLAVPERELAIYRRLFGHHGIKILGGEEHDVLARYHAVAKSLDAEIVVRLTGDCPILDPAVSDAVVRLLLQQLTDSGPHYAANIQPHTTWPDGLDTEAFTWSALNCAHHYAAELSDREHATPWVQRHIPSAYLPCDQDLTACKWSVDTSGDLALVERMFQRGLTGTDYRGAVEVWRQVRQELMAQQQGLVL